MVNHTLTVNDKLEIVTDKDDTIKGKDVGEGIITVTAGSFTKEFKINVIPAKIIDKIFIDLNGIYNPELGSVMGKPSSSIHDANEAFNVIATEDVDGYTYTFNARYKFTENIDFVYGSYLAVDKDLFDSIEIDSNTAIAGIVYRSKYMDEITSGDTYTLDQLIHNNSYTLFTRSNIESNISLGNMSKNLDVNTNRYIFAFNLDLVGITEEPHLEIDDLAIAYNTDLAITQKQFYKVEIITNYSDLDPEVIL